MTDPIDSRAFAYDQVPYVGSEDLHTHIRQSETIGTLFGLQPTDVTHCRVLEVGCASGRNLLPQALEFSDSQFIGLDLSAEQIASAEATRQKLQLENIDLRHASIEDIDEDWGLFDYILCPGVFSWVMPDLQDRLLMVCKRNLAPRGIALISYNTYPGWRFHEVARDIMRYHAGKYETAAEQVLEARKLIRFMERSAPEGSSHALFYQETSRFLDRSRDAYIYHDYLVDDNRPLYFHEFANRAEQAGLRFLAEANFANMVTSHMPEQIRQVLDQTPLIQREQFLDFLRNTAYRKTLLCHAEVERPISLSVDAFRSLHVSLAKMPEPKVFDVSSDERIDFRLDHRQMTTSHPLGKAALRTLMDVRPRSLDLSTLCDHCLRLLPPDHALHRHDRGELIGHLQQAMAGCYAAGMIHAFVHPPQLAAAVSERPRANPLSRQLAADGKQVTSQLNESVMLDAWHLVVLSLLDGQHDLASLQEKVLMKAGQKENLAVKDGREVHLLNPSELTEALGAALHELRLQGLLIA